MPISILLYTIISLLFLAGFIFVFVPIFPGIIFSIAAIVIHIVWQGIGSLGQIVLWLIIGLCVLYFFIDLLAGYFGAKKFGASKLGFLGTILGAIFGAMLLGLPGVILGPVLGGALFEFLGSRDIKKSYSVAAGALAGFLLGTLGKFAIITAVTALFLWKIVLFN